MDKIKTEYKGIEIEYINDAWRCHCDYGVCIKEKYSAVTKWIDDREAYNKKKNFKRFEVICDRTNYTSNHFEIATVTSMDERGRINVTFADGSRRIDVNKYVFASTDKKYFLRIYAGS